jgi:hypothetical protein
VGDSVIVAKRKDPDKVYVVGHMGGIKSCGWRILLVRGDGTPVIPTMDGHHVVGDVIIAIDDKTETTVPTTKTYIGSDYSPPVPGLWKVESSVLPPNQFTDPDGYYLWYNCPDGILTQQKYKYKTLSQYEAADRVSKGYYTDTIPYWLWDNSDAMTWGAHLVYTYPPLPYVTCVVDDPGTHVRIALIAAGGSIPRNVKIFSSVPYDLRCGTVGRLSVQTTQWANRPYPGDSNWAVKSISPTETDITLNISGTVSYSCVTKIDILYGIIGTPGDGNATSAVVPSSIPGALYTVNASWSGSVTNFTTTWEHIVTHATVGVADQITSISIWANDLFNFYPKWVND